ncbi:MAG: alpha/beta hydrolase [Myxococcota bacterium]
MMQSRCASTSPVGRLRLVALVVGLLSSAAACERSSSSAPATVPTLAELDADGDVKALGKRLMAITPGTHRLDRQSPDPTKVIIGVHGHGSEGYEWIYPLERLGETKAQIHFHRWDYEQCPGPMAATLDTSVDSLLKAQPSIESLQIVAHSYGGVVAGLVAADYDGRVPLTVDIVASPLAGIPQLNARCDYDGPKPPAEGVTLRQWRIRQELDGAFRDMDPDPQLVDLPGEVTELPESYRGHRLGHNWAISWVADRIGGDDPPP